MEGTLLSAHTRPKPQRQREEEGKYSIPNCILNNSLHMKALRKYSISTDTQKKNYIVKCHWY